MDQPSANPYASPTADALQPKSGRTPDVRPLWIWLAIAAGLSFFCTPADPFSTLLALAYGLGFFCVGSIFASSLHIVLRALPLIVWVVPAGWLALTFGHPYFILGAVFYALISIVMGYWAHRSIQIGRMHILTSFYVGYVLGSIFGVFGTVVVAALATIIARRSLRIPDVSSGG